MHMDRPNSLSDMDSLFSSQERIQVLRFLLFRTNQYFTEQELIQALSRKALAAGRTLVDLEKMGAIKKLRNSDTGDYVYRANKHWLLYDDFRSLFIKSQLIVEHELVRKLPKLGSIRLFVLTGMFVGDVGAPTDMLIVGKINQRALSTLIEAFEKDIGQEVNYTALTMPEYTFRQNVGDRFIHGILENKHLVLADYLAGEPPIELVVEPVNSEPVTVERPKTYAAPKKKTVPIKKKSITSRHKSGKVKLTKTKQKSKTKIKKRR